MSKPEVPDPRRQVAIERLREKKEKEQQESRRESQRQGWVPRGAWPRRRDVRGQFIGSEQPPSDYDYGADSRP